MAALESETQLQSRHGFRMQVCLGRGATTGTPDVDALTPAASAPHSDAFRVTTLASDAFGPSIMGIPTGVHQEMNPSSRATSKGRMTVRLLDEELDADDPGVRWLTAFLNTIDQKDQLAGLKVIIWETHDGGATWEYYFTGRISADDWENGTTVYRLDINDMSGDLEFDIFVGIPHGDANNGVRYAYPQPCLPVGIPFDYLGLTPTAPMRGIGQTVAGKRRIASTSAHARLRAASVTEAFKTLADDVDISATVLAFLPQYVLLYNGDQCEVYVGPAGGATTFGPYPLREVELWEPSDATDQHYRAKSIYAEGFTDGLVNGVAGANHPALSAGPQYDYRILQKGASTKAFPMLVGQRQGIHAVQMFKDICQGYFARLDPDTGAVVYTMAIDEDAFDALIADATFAHLHDMPDQVYPAIEYIEDVIGQTAQVGWRLDGQGRVVPIDLRLTATTEAAFTIEEGHLTDNPDAFKQGGEKRDAITRVNAKYYVDQQLSLDAEKGTGVWTTVPQTYIESHEVPVEYADFTPKARDIGDQPIDWDAQGLRLGLTRNGQLTGAGGEIVRVNTGRRAALVAQMLQAIAERRRPFRSKPNTYTIEVDRVAALAGVAIGQYGVAACDQMVNPETNERFGRRLVLVTRVEYVDAVTAKYALLDVGPASLVEDPESEDPVTPGVTEPPVLDNYIAVAGSEVAVQVDAELNAAGDFVAFRIAETETTVAAVEDVPESAWYPAGSVDRDRTVTFAPVAGPRVWLQGRSEPGLGTQTGTTTVPSIWVSPLNAEYVDLDTIDPPTSPAVADVTQSTCTFSWVPAAQGYPLEVWYGVGTLTQTTLLTIGARKAFLPPNSTALGLAGLAGPSTTVTLGVRHVDQASGRVSAFAIVTFATGGAGTLVAPRMAGIGLLGDA